MDIYWRDAVQCPSEEEYKTMVIRSRYRSLEVGIDMCLERLELGLIITETSPYKSDPRFPPNI